MAQLYGFEILVLHVFSLLGDVASPKCRFDSINGQNIHGLKVRLINNYLVQGKGNGVGKSFMGAKDHVFHLLEFVSGFHHWIQQFPGVW